MPVQRKDEHARLFPAVVVHGVVRIVRRQNSGESRSRLVGHVTTAPHGL